MEAFWSDVERQYKCCNVMMIPQEHIPLWYARCVDAGIAPEDAAPEPVKPFTPKQSVPVPVERPPDLRTVEGRAWRAAHAVGV